MDKLDEKIIEAYDKIANPPKEEVNEGGMHPKVIEKYFDDIEFIGGDKNINRIVSFVKIHDKKLGREINTFFIDFYKKLEDYKKEVVSKYTRKDNI